MKSTSKKSSVFNTESSNEKYIMLLQRLDEEQGVCEPSIEEKLKLAVSYICQLQKYCLTLIQQ